MGEAERYHMRAGWTWFFWGMFVSVTASLGSREALDQSKRYLRQDAFDSADTSLMYSKALNYVALLAIGALVLATFHLVLEKYHQKRPRPSAAEADEVLAALVAEVQGLQATKVLTEEQVGRLKAQAAAIEPLKDLPHETLEVLKGGNWYDKWGVALGAIGVVLAVAAWWYSIVNS